MGKVSLAIKNLDKSHKARMARAKEQGFDVDNTVYHGTSGNDIYDFDMGKARNSKAVYVTKSPWVAQNEGGYLDESFKDILGVDEWEKSNEKFNTSIYPLHIRGNIAGKEDIKEALNVTGAGSKNDDRVIEYLKSKGFDGAADSNYETLIFDPKNIRSKFAQFDPAKKDSSNLLANVGAGVGTAGIIGAGMAPEDAEAGALSVAKSVPELAERIKGIDGVKTFTSQAVKTNKNLDKSHKARMARAKEQGFDVDIYHKTWGENFGEKGDEFTEFSKDKMQQSDYGYAGKGVYATKKPLGGTTYGNVTMPLTTNIKNPYIRNMDNWEDDLDPYQWIPKNSENYESMSATSAAWTEMMKGRGYDSFIDETSGGEINIFDPKNIRSKFADFDPDKIESSNLLANVGAGVGTAGIIGAGMAPEDAEAAAFGKSIKYIEQGLKEGRQYLYHSGDASIAEDVAKYGLEPQHGDWIQEVMSKAVDDPEEYLDGVPAATWFDKAPGWVKIQASRRAGKPLSKMTNEDIKDHGMLAIVDPDSDWHSPEDFYQIPSEGVMEGQYTKVKNLSGEEMPLYETPLYDYDDFGGGGRYTAGLEPHDIVSTESIEPETVLTGQELVDFLKKNYGADIQNTGYIKDYERGQISPKALAATGGVGLTAAALSPQDAEASFIGQAAKTFNKQALKQAELMEAQGAPREAIWKATGYQHNAPMMRGADGKWRQEISDKTLRINEEMPDDITEWLSQMDDATYPVQMDDFVDTPVYNAYPDIADAGVTLNAGTNTGYFTPSTGRYNLPGGHDHEGYLRFPELQRSVAGHELQHGIQEIEGFAKGGSPDEFVSDLAALSKLNDMSFADMDDFQKAMYKDLKEKYKGVSDPDAQYRRLAGEAEARNVQTRLDMDMKERIDTPMNRTLDVPEDELIVRNNAAKSYLAKSSERRKKMSDKKMQRDIMRRGQYRKDTGQYFQTKGEAAQDAMTTIAKPLAAQIISGVTSVGLSPFTDPDDLAEYIKDYTQQWTHTPEGRRSAEILGKLGHNLQPVMDIVGKYARGAIAAGGLATGGSLDDAVNLIENDKRSINEIMGQKTLDATGSPAAAAFVHAAPDALL